MKKVLYGLLIIVFLAIIFGTVPVLADANSPNCTATPVPPVDTPMLPTETAIPNTKIPPAPTSTDVLPTLPPTPTEEISTVVPTPIASPTVVSDPTPYPIITETTAPYPAPKQAKHKAKSTPEVLPDTGFFDQNPFAPLIVLAVVCVSAFGASRVIRKHGEDR